MYNGEQLLRSINRKCKKKKKRKKRKKKKNPKTENNFGKQKLPQVVSYKFLSVEAEYCNAFFLSGINQISHKPRSGKRVLKGLFRPAEGFVTEGKRTKHAELSYPVTELISSDALSVCGAYRAHNDRTSKARLRPFCPVEIF